MGAGFSYVNKTNAYARDLATVVSDMIFLLKSFFDFHKEFEVSGPQKQLSEGLAVIALNPSGANTRKELHAQLIPEKTFLYPGIRLWVSVVSKDGFSLKE